MAYKKLSSSVWRMSNIKCHKQNNASEMENGIQNAKENFTQLKISGNGTEKLLNLQQLVFKVAS